jgi:hypothetical protein
MQLPKSPLRVSSQPRGGDKAVKRVGDMCYCFCPCRGR